MPPFSESQSKYNQHEAGMLSPRQLLAYLILRPCRGNTFLRNVSELPPQYTELYRIKQYSAVGTKYKLLALRYFPTVSVIVMDVKILKCFER